MTWRPHPLVRLVVPGLPPSVNRTRRWSKSRGFDPANACALAAKADFEREVWAAFKSTYPGRPPERGPLVLRAWFIRGDRRDFDWDNPLKCLQDALKTARAFVDDSQIRRGEIEKLDPEPGRARTVVELWPWTATGELPDGQ